MGRACWSYHDFGKASSESRCFNCGALDHKADACTRPKERRAGKGEESAPRGESSGSGIGTANAAGKGNAGNPKGPGARSDPKGAQVERQMPQERGMRVIPRDQVLDQILRVRRFGR